MVHDGPDKTSSQIISMHHLQYFLNFFDRVRVLYWAKKEEGSEVFRKENGKFVFYPYPKPYNSSYLSGIRYMFWISKTLNSICREKSKDSKLVFMPVIPLWAGLPTLIIGKIRKIKVVLRLEAKKIDYVKKEGALENRRPVPLFLKVLILKLVYCLTMPFFDVVMGISEGVSKGAKRYGAKKVITIPNPVDLEMFSPAGEKALSKKSHPTILYVGQIKKIKGIHLLVQAVKSLKRESGLAPKVLIAGVVTNPKDERYYEELQEMSRGLDIRFLGWVPHKKLPAVYRKADVFLLPSYTEALGKVTMEAMASGLPVVATKTSGSKYLIEDGETGFLVPIGDVEDIKQKIKMLIENPDLKERMSKAGRKKIKETMGKSKRENKQLWESIA